MATVTIDEALGLALDHHQNGRFVPAEQIYRDILKAEPSNANALHYLGLMAHQKGQHEEAIELIERAITIVPDATHFWCTLAVVYRVAEQPNRSIECCRRALAIKPDSAEAHLNLGKALNALGRLDAAVDSCRTALKHRPAYAVAHCNLAAMLQKLERLDEAMHHAREAVRMLPKDFDARVALAKCFWARKEYGDAAEAFKIAVELRPDAVETQIDLACALAEAGQTEAAIRQCQVALVRKPDYAEGFHNFGVILLKQRRLAEAEAACREALRLKPDYAQAHANLASALRYQRRYDEALDHLQRGLALDPDLMDGYNVLGAVKIDLGLVDEALEQYDQALQREPDNAWAHFNRGVALLLKGDFQRGWAEYEWRWKVGDLPDRHFDRPRWDGEPLAGRSILVHAEQGLGDTIHFVRFLSELQKNGARVVFYCPRKLAPLMSSCDGIDQLVPDSEKAPPTDLQVPLLSLPRLLGTTLENIPASHAYLRPSDDAAATWKSILRKDADLKVGVCWQGNPEHTNDHNRSTRLNFFRPLLEISGIQVISLQHGEGVEQLDDFPPIETIENLAANSRVPVDGFATTAAAIANLDLVISVDTAVAHLAGALGVRTWVLLPFAPEWRWLTERIDSPWYPTARLFRQRNANDWQELFQRVGCELRDLAADARETS